MAASYLSLNFVFDTFAAWLEVWLPSEEPKVQLDPGWIGWDGKGTGSVWYVCLCVCVVSCLMKSQTQSGNLTPC